MEGKKESKLPREGGEGVPPLKLETGRGQTSVYAAGEGKGVAYLRLGNDS